MKLPAELGSLTDLKRRESKAFERSTYWSDQLDDAYEYFLPNRNLFEDSRAGQKKMDKIFDSTALEAIQQGASKLQENIAPIWSRWATLEPSNQVKLLLKNGQYNVSEEDIRSNLEELSDIIFDYIKSLGYENIFVEIGGEVRFSGHNRNLDKWSIGLENPPSALANVEDSFFGIYKGESFAIATSANYRNFVDLDGTILGHTINPKTGFPVQTDVLSVSVVAETCMEADAWATALMTLSYEDGLKILDKFKNIGAAWLLKTGKTTRIIAKKGDFRIIEPIFEMK